jgi:hypothetical protein
LIFIPLLASPLAITVSATPTTKLKGHSNLLTSCRGCVESNIKKIMELITQASETSKSIASFGMRAHAFQEYLQVDLKNEEGLYLDTAIPFGINVTNMKEMRRRE